MHCLVTAGPTFESLDQVRRLTNFSTGRLGTELAEMLSGKGHHVTLLRGEASTWSQPSRASRTLAFTDTESLLQHLKRLSECGENFGAVFHAAAVSDFRFGRIWTRDEQGGLQELHAGKLSTRDGTLMAELVPTPKVIAQLRGLFPSAHLVGWKYEVEGTQADLVGKAALQIRGNRTNACVINGPAYGIGFGVVDATTHLHPLATREALLSHLVTGLPVQPGLSEAIPPQEGHPAA